MQDIDDTFVDEQVTDRDHGGDGEEPIAGVENEQEHDLVTVPDSRIRKIRSGRQAASKRWKQVQMHSVVFVNSMLNYGSFVFVSRQADTENHCLLIMTF